MIHYAGCMRKLLLIAMLTSTAAFAQSDNSMLVVGGPKDTRPASEIEHERVLNNFPEWAVTRVGAATGGTDQDIAPTPAAPTTPSAGSTPAVAPAPATPAAPASATAKLWPVDTVPIFMKSCVNFQPKLVVPCNCVIGRLMLAMPHDEFIKLTAQGTVEQDPRLQNILTECAVKAAAEQ